MSSPIKNVAVAGASGYIGKAAVRALMDAGFAVTVLTREGSTSTFPAGTVQKSVDYSSVESLASALEGQDALVSTLASLPFESQTPLVDAAVAAGVRRIIPSEYGINTRILRDEPIGTILGSKAQTLNYIHEKWKQNPSFTWTGISQGLSFDWGLIHGSLGLDKTTKTATIFDSGDEPYQSTSLSQLGKAVVSVLAHPIETANRYMTIASFNPTQNQVLAAVEKITGEKWAVNRVPTSGQQQIGCEKLGRGDYGAFRPLLMKRVYEDGAGLAVLGPDNAGDLLGLEGDDIEGLLRAWLAE
ncbi:hypothetical protein F4802DRAFT_508999 [Xylaria palmicola]|nr:hypothetical protein F4802DRAFT_508999 [Xylaria palmicola]